MLRRLREDSSKNYDGDDGNNISSSSLYASLSPAEKRRKLEQAMEVDGGEELCKNLPELVKLRRDRKTERVKNLEVRNASLRRIIAGYQNALGASVTEYSSQVGGNKAVLQQ